MRVVWYPNEAVIANSPQFKDGIEPKDVASSQEVAAHETAHDMTRHANATLTAVAGGLEGTTASRAYARAYFEGAADVFGAIDTYDSGERNESKIWIMGETIFKPAYQRDLRIGQTITSLPYPTDWQTANLYKNAVVFGNFYYRYWLRTGKDYEKTRRLLTEITRRLSFGTNEVYDHFDYKAALEAFAQAFPNERDELDQVLEDMGDNEGLPLQTPPPPPPPPPCPPCPGCQIP